MSRHSIERCFEEAEDRGQLVVQHRNLKNFPLCADSYDLGDVLFVDLSRNKFNELPQELMVFTMLEKLICTNNMLKTISDISHLETLTYLDVSQNQLQTIPVHICNLPLKILKASYNKINVLPTQIGQLTKLQLLDVSCNELSNLPSSMGEMTSLRSLNARRNQITALPDELSKLKSINAMDLSCNRISVLPPAFRLIYSLIHVDLTNNPLCSPPAHVCLKGKAHIVKYLSMTAKQQEKRWTLSSEPRVHRSPSSNSLTSNNGIEQHVGTLERAHDVCVDNPNEIRPRRNTITNEEEEIDVGDNPQATDNIASSIASSITPSIISSITSPSVKDEPHDSTPIPKPRTNIATKETFIPPSPLEVPARKEKPKIARKPNSFSLPPQDATERQKILKEKGRLTPHLRSPNDVAGADRSLGTMSLDRHTNRPPDLPSNDVKDDKVDLATRKEQLLKDKEEILRSKQRLEFIKTNQQSSSSVTSPSGDRSTKDAFFSPSKPLSPLSPSSSTSKQGSPFEGISPRSAIPLKSNTKKFLDGASNYTMRRFYDSAKEEFEQLEKLREAVESRLRIKLPDDLPSALSDGIVLCHLVNHLRKSTISTIHVPSAGVPKLTMPKCQMNVDAFLDACRKVGVDKTDICGAADVLEEKSPTRLCRTVQALLSALGAAPPQIVMVKQNCTV